MRALDGGERLVVGLTGGMGKDGSDLRVGEFDDGERSEAAVAQSESIVPGLVGPIGGLRDSRLFGGLKSSTEFREAMLRVETAFTQLAESVAGVYDSLPPNLAHVHSARELIEVIDFSRSSGLPVLWVPPAEVLATLLATKQEDRPGLLVKRRDELLTACAEVARECPGNQRASLLLDAIDAACDGYDAPAQALASSIIESIVIDAFPNLDNERHFERNKVARESADRDTGDVRFSDSLFQAAISPIVHAYKSWWVNDRDVPSTFNRHATTHGANFAGVYTEINMITAVLVATSMTRFSAETGTVG